MMAETYGSPVENSQCSADAEVNRTDILCENNSVMMMDFSRQCVGRLNRHFTFRLFISLVRHFLEANVNKEINKDSLVIRHAAAGFESGRERAHIVIDDLFELTKQVDHEFMSKVPVHFFSSEVRHEDFAEIRKQRIELLVDMVFTLLSKWHDPTPYEIIVQRTYSEHAYREMLGEVLRLYNLETKALGSAISFHGPARRMRDVFAEKLFSTLEATAEDIAAEYTRKIYHNKTCQAVQRSSV